MIGFFLVGLPFLIVNSFSNRGPRPRRLGDDVGTFRLAHESGILAAPALLRVVSSFLLIVIAGLFAGDSVAGDSNWGNLRYLLLRPVGRVRLLVVKTFVALLQTWVAVFLLTGAAGLAGVLKFGAHDIHVQGIPAQFNAGVAIPTFDLTVADQIWRVALSAGLVSFGFLALLGLGVLFSTLAEAPTAAIGGAIGVYIVSQIIDGIDTFGKVRYGLPTHYSEAWRALLVEHQFTKEMGLAVLVQVSWFTVAWAAAAVWFRRKDVQS